MARLIDRFNEGVRIRILVDSGAGRIGFNEEDHEEVGHFVDIHFYELSTDTEPHSILTIYDDVLYTLSDDDDLVGFVMIRLKDATEWFNRPRGLTTGELIQELANLVQPELENILDRLKRMEEKLDKLTPAWVDGMHRYPRAKQLVGGDLMAPIIETVLEGKPLDRMEPKFYDDQPVAEGVQDLSQGKAD